MDETLTIDEIQSRFPAEWVLLADPVLSKGLRVLRGRVVFHSRDRTAFDKAAIQLRPRHAASVFTGPIDAHTVFIL